MHGEWYYTTDGMGAVWWGLFPRDDEQIRNHALGNAQLAHNPSIDGSWYEINPPGSPEEEQRQPLL